MHICLGHDIAIVFDGDVLGVRHRSRCSALRVGDLGHKVCPADYPAIHAPLWVTAAAAAAQRASGQGGGMLTLPVANTVRGYRLSGARSQACAPSTPRGPAGRSL